MEPLATLAVGAAGCAALAWRHMKDRTRRRVERAAFFDDCLSLLEAPRVTPRGPDFPLLQGRHAGAEVRIEPLVEGVTPRKLPMLLLLVTRVEPLPVGGAFDLMMRALGVEFYSPWNDLPGRLATPEGWPETASLRCQNPAALPPLPLVEQHLELFRGPRGKELLITPRGLRFVLHLADAQRGTFLLLRQATFDLPRLPPDLLSDVLRRSAALAADLKAGTHEHSTRQHAAA